MKWYVEHRAIMHRTHRLWFVPLEEQWEMGAETRSLYAYPEDVVRAAAKTDTIAKLDHPYLRADWLFIDVDSGKDDVLKIERRLAPYTYEKWIMGTSDKAHFHLPLAKPMMSSHVISSQKRWLAKTLGINAPIDWSIYLSTGQIRMPGTINHKRWAVKVLSHRNIAEPLEIPIWAPPPRLPSQREVEGARATFVRLATSPECGRGRHYRIFRICAAAKEAGIGIDKTLAAVIRWNYRWASSPLSEQDATEHALRVYRSAR